MGNKLKNSMSKKIISNLKHGSDESIGKGISILDEYKRKKSQERSARLENVEEKSGFNFKILIIVIVIIVLFFIAYIFLEYAPIFGINIFNNSSTKVATIESVSNGEIIYKNYNNELLIYTNNTLVTYDSNGKKNWEYKITETFNPEIYINKDYMVIANKSNGNIYIFSGKNELANKKIDGTIDSIFLDEKGNIAVEYSSSGYKKIIAVFDKYGKSKYTAYVDAASIIDIKLLDNASKLLLIQTDSSSLTIGTKVSIIDSSKEQSIKKLFTIENKLVFNSVLLNSEIILVTNDSIIRYDTNSETKTEVHSLDSNQTNYVSLSTNYFVAIETNKNKYNFITNKFDNTNISTVELKVLPKYIRNSGFLTYIVSENEIIVMNKWGMVVKDIDINLPPKDIIIYNNEKSVALIYSNRVEIIKL